MSTDPSPGRGRGDLTGLDVSSRAFTRTVDALTDDELAAPSLLPGWTRAHVVAHVALNGYALAGVINGLVHGRPVPMYESNAKRDGDIEELSHAGSSELREHHLIATTQFVDAVSLLDDSHWSAHIDRLPGGPAWPMSSVLPTRRRELEIHHVDLDVAHTPADWPDDFVVELLDAVVLDQAGSGPFRVHALDLDRAWTVGGQRGPTVSGTGAGLGWWLTGRGSGEGLRSDAGELPALGPWLRAPGS